MVARSVQDAVDTNRLRGAVRDLAAELAAERRERQPRRELDAATFDRLREAGFLLAAVPIEDGGLWESEAQTTRLICDLLRTLARGDSSVALVAAMHPSVLYVTGWLARPDAEPPYTEAWREQRRQVFQTVLDGAWWGTITSEPGSGGDIGKTAAVARPNGTDGAYRLTGAKQFGSGSGHTSFMITTAVPAGETAPDWFFMDVRGVAWDGSSGVTLVAPWDGHGMIATHSHALRFDDFPATRVAWPGMYERLRQIPSGVIPCAFSAVAVGIVDVAMETARRQLGPKRTTLRAFEQVEWARAEMEAWLIGQAFEGMLRAVEAGAGGEAIKGKMAIAELAEAALSRVCRVVGGGTYSRLSPFGFWAEDVRALGFLRPPWGLAYDQMFALSWPNDT